MQMRFFPMTKVFSLHYSCVNGRVFVYISDDTLFVTDWAAIFTRKLRNFQRKHTLLLSASLFSIITHLIYLHILFEHIITTVVITGVEIICNAIYICRFLLFLYANTPVL